MKEGGCDIITLIVWGFLGMPTEFKLDFLKSNLKYNRIIYILMVLFTVFLSASGVIKSTIVLIYYVLLFLLFLGIDELLFKFKYQKLAENEGKFPTFLFHSRTIIYVTLITAGCVFEVLPAALVVIVLYMVIYLLAQDTILGDVFDVLLNTIRNVAITVVVCLFLFFIQYRKEIKIEWIIEFFISTGIVTMITVLVQNFYYRTVVHFDDKYTKLYFKTSDVIAENNKLIQFREKVEKVNNEINYQKINLTKANDDLAKSNEEVRSLIQVMKYFSGSFDVEKNAHVMINNVMEIKKTGAVALYIDRDIYMNEEPYVEVISYNDVTSSMLKQDIPYIYNSVKARKNLEPLVLCENFDFKQPYLTGGNICNAVAFPAYENDTVYGVMVVTSSKYDFFEKGYSFYESSIMDFTSALISDRLYLKTEDMAKKDGLTKIYNRVYFNQFYPQLIKEVEESGDVLTVCMLDIDHFKNINDTYGHLAGDEVIKTVASIDQKYAKMNHGTAVRYGGEEFLMILRNIKVPVALSILMEMHDEIVDTIVNFEGQEISINTSIGIASYPETCDNINEVLDRADQAMYFSKENGRGMIVIDGLEEEAIRMKNMNTEGDENESTSN